MIAHMGSKTVIAILEWMKGKTFTREDLSHHLDAIGFSDPYAGGSVQSPIERIMQSIKRNGYASYENKVWVANDDYIDQGIKMHRSMPSPEAEETLQTVTDKIKNMFGDSVTPDIIQNTIAESGRQRRERRKA